MSFKVLIIGGVACGPKTASMLKSLRPDAEITIIEKGRFVSYGACGLPYYVEGVFSDVDELIKTPVGVPRTPAFFENVKGVKVLTQMEALKIDPAKKAVRVGAGFQDVRDVTAARVVKDLPDGTMREFTVFLMTGRK
jgi:NADPH-dependent 2,4-dienoyl-CoA reductase/sulfur reductase-like enzyme